MNIIKTLKFTVERRFITLAKTTKSQQFHTITSTNMPLVVPGINSTDAGSKTNDWMNKLAGKKLGDVSDATVRGLTIFDELRNEC